VVCDGFVGNTILKYTESFLQVFQAKVRTHANGNLLARAGLALLAPAMRALHSEFDYQSYGGVPLLGVNGVSMVCHGGSSPLALQNAVLEADRLVQRRIHERIRERVSDIQWQHAPQSP